MSKDGARRLGTQRPSLKFPRRREDDFMGELKSLDTIVRDQTEYCKFFPDAVREEALKTALDVRKFEIDLYWKRAAYFWTFIAATFVGFGAAQQLADEGARVDLSVVSSCLGIIFSFSWFCINKGSKYWQMNWEKHVDMLEDEKVGPLYKLNWLPDPTASHAARLRGTLLEFGRFSPTRINQLVSFFVFLMWIVLLIHVLPFNQKGSVSPLYVALVALTVAFCVVVVIYGQSGREKSLTKFKIRGDVERQSGAPLSGQVQSRSGEGVNLKDAMHRAEHPD
jgi:hypothetical protein